MGMRGMIICLGASFSLYFGARCINVVECVQGRKVPTCDAAGRGLASGYNEYQYVSPVSLRRGCILMWRAVERFIEKNRLPHLLFYGPPGTGKTSTIIAVARRIYGADFRKHILEVKSSPLRASGVLLNVAWRVS
jgi:hypothetical protein